jgi:hypothetical protein
MEAFKVPEVKSSIIFVNRHFIPPLPINTTTSIFLRAPIEKVHHELYLLTKGSGKKKSTHTVRWDHLCNHFDKYLFAGSRK